MNDLSVVSVPFVPAPRGAGLNSKSSGHGSYLAMLAIMGCLTGAAAAAQFGDFTYEVFGNSISITDYPDSATGHVVIPSTIAGKPVKVIESTAFNQIPGLTGITIPNSVVSLEMGAFAECTGLTSVTIPSSVTNIGPEVFYGCTSLTGVTIPSSVTSIGGHAFDGCAALTEIAIPPGLTTIEAYLFQGCSSLAGVVIPNGVSSIGESAFAQCIGLTAVTVPGTVTSIESSAFNGCDELKSVYLPAGLESIGSFAFADCGKLKSITIPASVTSMGDSVFDQCEVLNFVFFMGNAPDMGDTVFLDIDQNTALRIYYYSGKTGFTTQFWTPTIGTYWTVVMQDSNPMTPWLIVHELLKLSQTETPPYPDIQEDANGDGVNLLTAYALNLDPSQNLSGSMPKAVVAGNQMSMSYFSGALGISYTVLTSSDLVNWTTEGVTLSAPDGSLMRKASVNIGNGPKFMKLKINN